VITVLAVLESWRTRYALSTAEWVELAEQVSLSIDWPGHRHPPMQADMAHKLGERTFAAAVRKVLRERLCGGLPGMEYAAPTVDQTAQPTITGLVPASCKHVRRSTTRRCSACREPGHNAQTCRQRRAA